MRDIYSKAEVVRVWLGEAADDSDQVIRVIEELFIS